MMQAIEWCNHYILSALVPLSLLVAGIFFAYKLRAFPFIHPLRMWRRMMRPRQKGGISPLRALSLALAGTLGVGNLVGVSAAIAMGGAGAIFWMWISATLAMLLKYAEIVLALRHRRLIDGEVCGSAMYYMEDCFHGKRHARWGRRLAVLFAGLCVIDAFSMGCVVQVNAVAGAWQGLINAPPWLIGVAMALLVYLVGVRGARGISACTERLVPLMTVGFAVVSMVAIGKHADMVPRLLQHICLDAFDIGNGHQGVLGGVLGFLLSRSLRFGTMRGLLSNEAGCGTSPMAHATAQTDDAAAQGCMGIVEVFVDTHVLCTMTALVVLLAQEQTLLPTDVPMLMTLRAYEALLGTGAAVFIGIAVLFFGLATVFCWSHYAMQACSYLAGDRVHRASLVRRLTLVSYCVFCVLGAIVAPQSVWALSDFSIGSMTVLNVGFLCYLWREVVKESRTLIQ